jgi:DNA-binding CsgD family transcriptional regulator
MSAGTLTRREASTASATIILVGPAEGRSELSRALFRMGADVGSDVSAVDRLEELAGLGAASAEFVTGVVLSSELDSALGPCLAAVRAGQLCVPVGNRRHLQRPVLSMREKQILGLVVMGYLNSQIARRLYLAESTVKSHLTSAFGKLEVRSRHEAVDLILNPEFGLALGILSLGGEPVQEIASETL